MHSPAGIASGFIVFAEKNVNWIVQKPLQRGIYLDFRRKLPQQVREAAKLSGYLQRHLGQVGF